MYVKRDTLEHNDRNDWVNVKRVTYYLKAYRGRAVFALLCLIAATSDKPFLYCYGSLPDETYLEFSERLVGLINKAQGLTQSD